MIDNKVMVKTIDCVEKMAFINSICFNIEGILTENKLELIQIWNKNIVLFLIID